LLNVTQQQKGQKREALPQSEFGLPGERKYPMPDASHATNAKARAKAEIDAKADRKLGKGK
jgi:hypothetical protein